MQIYQPLCGYAYNSDTLFLYHFALPLIKERSRALEIGSGSGILGLLCARDRGLELVMVEREREMAIYSEHNARINAIEVEVMERDFLSLQIGELAPFDLALSNPPFYHRNVLKSQNPSILAARYEENLPFKECLVQLKRFLKPRGSFIFCFDAKQSDRVFFELKEKGFNPEMVRFVHPRITKEATLVMVQARLSSKSPLKVLPPLVVYEGEDYSSEAKSIFKAARTHSIKCQL
ncbi:tRNA1(Val) (adenine(37)-N6)-methyltransferase [Wolinella succinogenes]|uniref:tRNA1(Val) (adenine(37)-N6)-methyltransferase n=1 Tax=Wolinella succinogenes TaxID=844 RepID=UPI00240A040B|nr:methyltransferase [Wolinella succinogenes]